jgi:hypothetical protein
MKKIILDHFRRWRVVMILFGAIFFLFAGFMEREGGSEALAAPFDALLNHMIFYVYIFQILIFYLGFFLMMDLRLGLARALTALPVTTKQIGRSLWLASVAIPAAALTVIGFFALLVFSIGANRAMPFGSYLLSCVIAAPTLGAMFGATTFTTTGIPETFLDRIRAMFSNVFMMLPIFGLLFFDKKNPNMTEAILIFAALTILTIIGWFHAEQLVVNRAGFRPASSHPRKQTAQYKTPTDFGGISFLIIKTTSQVLLMYLFLAAVMLAIPMLMTGHHTLEESVKINASGYNLVIFSAWAVGLFQIFPMFIQLRLLRTLPISTIKLAASLVFLPIISLALLGIIIGFFFFPFVGQMKAMEVATTFLIPMTMVSVGIPLVAWLGLERNTLALIGLGFFIGIAVVPLWFSMDKIPFMFRYTAVALLILVSFFSTKSSLARSSKAYRINLANLGAWGGRRWQ